MCIGTEEDVDVHLAGCLLDVLVLGRIGPHVRGEKASEAPSDDCGLSDEGGCRS